MYCEGDAAVILSFRLCKRDYLTCSMVIATASGIAQKGLWPLFIDHPVSEATEQK
jgi:hypothetical protein